MRNSFMLASPSSIRAMLRRTACAVALGSGVIAFVGTVVHAAAGDGFGATAIVPDTLNSGSLAQALPFVGTQAPATAPAARSTAPQSPQIQAPQVLAPGGVRAGDPHAILPPPPAGKAAIGMSARFGEAEPLVPRGLVWRVFADRPEASGAYPLVAEAAEPAPVFFLSPGGYVVHVSYGLASVARRIMVGEQSRREQMTLSAGAVKLQSDVNDKPIPQAKVSYDIFEGSFLQGRASSRPFFRGANSGETIILPAGDYYVVSTYGEGNAVIQADLAVASGKLTDATLHHRAAEMSLRLVQSKGGAALPNTQWSVLSPGGDAIKETTLATPSFVLAEGEYVAIARYDGKTYSKEFNVQSGKDGPIELLLGEQTPVPGTGISSEVPPGDGTDGSGDDGVMMEGSGD